MGSEVAIIAEPGNNLPASSAHNDKKLLDHLDFHRAYKTSYEAGCIERANEIAAQGHAAAQRAFRESASEFEIHHAYCLATEQTETDLPYPNIVALNEHASILHYQNLRRDVPDKARSLLLDAGAQFNGYASDVTRTCAHDEPQFESLINSMETLQQTLCTEASSGTNFVDLNEKAHQLLATVMSEHELLHCSAEEAYTTGVTRTFLPHGLGHLLGLQVHDTGGHLINTEGHTRKPPQEHPMLRLTRKLEPGFVVTIEPGIYFIPSLLDELRQTALGRSVDWDRLIDLRRCGGIRIEDNVLITDTSASNLSRPALAAAGV
jgi:Xaa-Pro dipeptidase